MARKQVCRLWFLYFLKLYVCKPGWQNRPEFIPHIPAFVNNGKDRMLTFRPQPLKSRFVPVLSNGFGLKCCLNESIVTYGINALSIFRPRQMNMPLLFR